MCVDEHTLCGYAHAFSVGAGSVNMSSLAQLNDQIVEIYFGGPMFSELNGTYNIKSFVKILHTKNQRILENNFLPCESHGFQIYPFQLHYLDRALKILILVR